MRHFIYLCFLAVCCLFLSCSKQNVITPDDLTGTWELKAYYDGWTGKTVPVTDSIRQRVFTATKYQDFTNGQPVASGTYKLVKDQSVVHGTTGTRIIYNDNDNFLRTFVTISHDSLTFSDDAYDAGGSLYLKQ